MATTVEYIEFVSGEIRDNYAIRHNKMFAE